MATGFRSILAAPLLMVKLRLNVSFLENGTVLGPVPPRYWTMVGARKCFCLGL